MKDYSRLSSNDMRADYTKKFKQKYSGKKGTFATLRKVFFYARQYRFYLYL